MEDCVWHTKEPELRGGKLVSESGGGAGRNCDRDSRGTVAQIAIQVQVCGPGSRYRRGRLCIRSSRRLARNFRLHPVPGCSLTYPGTHVPVPDSEHCHGQAGLTSLQVLAKSTSFDEIERTLESQSKIQGQR
eukprot:2236953-Rhodomonas_salina.1